MIFDTDYWNSLNRKEKEEVTLNPAQLGYSLGGDPLKNLKAGIFTGTQNMELTFFNSPGKGQQKNAPESWTKTERQEMKELARVNEVNVTVHATPNMGGGGASFSGFTGQAFSDEARQRAVDEMGRTSEFAADVTGGGPVVLHMDGFQRPVYSAGEKEGENIRHFEKYKEEEKKTPLMFVDDKTGQIAQVSRQDELHIAVRDEKGNYVREDDGKLKMETKTFEDIQKDFENETPEVKEKNGNMLNYFFRKSREGQLIDLESRRYEHMERANRAKQLQERYGTMLEEYESTVKHSKDPERATEFLNKMISKGEIGMGISGIKELEEVREDPKKYLEEKENHYRNERMVWEGGASSDQRQAKEFQKNMDSFKDITTYGVEKEADTIARSAMGALEIEKKKKLKESLWVAPENWAVEMYGSHPKEYKKIIVKSRERMTELLQQNKGMGKEQAKRVAEDHIRGTFDIGHLNMWKKYFKGDEKGFAKWMDKNVRGLVKDKIIGHVHLSDNFGYQDEHIEMGEGNAPLQEFFKILKEEGFEGTIVAEPGGQREGQLHRAWTSALELGGSPIYRIDATSKDWTDIGGSYFGRTQSPNFMVGDYIPSKDWTLWSEVPFE